jgi:hypothetical protein
VREQDSRDPMVLTSRMPWFVWASLASVSCILVGVYWDISFHMTVGRDSFWTPAHVLIQLGGVTGGASGSYLILSTTLRRASPLGDRAIGVWGFRGPFGAFLATWGAVTMVVSAPFDDWWHSAYGLDVTVLSPPHMVLTLGILGVAVGGVLCVLATFNGTTGDASGPLRTRLQWILLAIGAECLVLMMTVIFESTFITKLHHSGSYRALAIVAPLTIVAFARASGKRWGATAVTAGYTIFMVAMLWLFPLFSAEPKLGPVYQPITHYIPLQFPILVIVPAIVIDIVRDRMAAWQRWQQAIVIGGAFVATLVAIEWPLASFLQTEASRNWMFGTHYHPYSMSPETLAVRGEFVPQAAGAFSRGIAVALVVAIISSGIGLVIGDAMRRVRR